jgi:single-stranded DNA-binding protein
VVVWGQRAENCSQYLAKGRQGYIEDSFHTRKDGDKEGSGRSCTEVMAQRGMVLGTGQAKGLRERYTTLVCRLRGWVAEPLWAGAPVV